MNRKVRLLLAIATSFAAITAVAVAASSPSVATGSATSVTTSSAILHGTINPGGAKTGWEFQWGLTNAYGSTSHVRYVAAGTKPVSVSLKVNNLIRGTRYHYRLVALNKIGGSTGQDRTLKTKGNPPPYAATGPVSQVSSDTATVTAVINPNGQKTTWFFQYGLTTSYGANTVGGTVPAGSSPVSVSEQLQGLAPGTIFHYRVVAKNGGLTETGADSTFMTYPNPAPKPTVHAKTRPRRDRHRPYIYTTSGHISGPSSIPSQYACSGTVEIRFFIGKRRVGRRFTTVDSGCTFSATTKFRHRPHKRHSHTTSTRLKVLVQYLGNGYLARNRARYEHVIAG